MKDERFAKTHQKVCVFNEKALGVDSRKKNGKASVGEYIFLQFG